MCLAVPSKLTGAPALTACGLVTPVASLVPPISGILPLDSPSPMPLCFYPHTYVYKDGILGGMMLRGHLRQYACPTRSDHTG